MEGWKEGRKEGKKEGRKEGKRIYRKERKIYIYTVPYIYKKKIVFL